VYDLWVELLSQKDYNDYYAGLANATNSTMKALLARTTRQYHPISLLENLYQRQVDSSQKEGEYREELKKKPHPKIDKPVYHSFDFNAFDNYLHNWQLRWESHFRALMVCVKCDCATCDELFGCVDGEQMVSPNRMEYLVHKVEE
jgi:hypothetical protein